MPDAKPDPIREKHAAAIEAILADVGVPDRAVKLIEALLTDAEDIEAQRDEYEEERDEALADLESRQASETQALEKVKYWFLDVMTHGKPMTDPRKILRIVEDAL